MQLTEPMDMAANRLINVNVQCTFTAVLRV
jgi:hypothetical protein